MLKEVDYDFVCTSGQKKKMSTSQNRIDQKQTEQILA